MLSSSIFLQFKQEECRFSDVNITVIIESANTRSGRIPITPTIATKFRGELRQGCKKIVLEPLREEVLIKYKEQMCERRDIIGRIL